MLFYINVDDLAAYRKKVVAAGGKIHVEEQEVPGMGRFSLFTDPERPHDGIVEGSRPMRKPQTGDLTSFLPPLYLTFRLITGQAKSPP